jgi:hypothetical protein
MAPRLPVAALGHASASLQSRAVAPRSPSQLALRRRIEALIRLAAPVLDVVLFVGDRVSRLAGRNEIEPEPPRRLGDRPARTPLGGPRDGGV